MRGDQVVIESEHNHVALLQALRQQVNTATFFIALTSKQDFAGRVSADGSFDVRVVHRWQRSAFAPHLLGRMIPSARGTRIEGRLDYGSTDNLLRWFMGLFLIVMGAFSVANRGIGEAWVFALGVAALGWLIPWFNYRWFRNDEEELCALFERIAQSTLQPVAVEPR